MKKTVYEEQARKAVDKIKLKRAYIYIYIQ